LTARRTTNPIAAIATKEAKPITAKSNADMTSPHYRAQLENGAANVRKGTYRAGDSAALYRMRGAGC